MTCELCTDPTCTGPKRCQGIHACTCQVDDPHWDATDAAHPAWWRGQEYGADAVCREVARWMADPAGELARGGGYSSPNLQDLRLVVITLATNVGCLRADLAEMHAENERLGRRRDELLATIARLRAELDERQRAK